MILNNLLFRKLVESTLKEIDLYSKNAEELLMGTAAQEGHMGEYRIQLGGGPALGIMQIEPTTHDDCWTNFLNYKHELKSRILTVSGLKEPSVEALQNNDIYSICIARVKYYRDREPIPDYKDLEGLAKYWKRVYNSEKGKGKPEEFIKNYKKYVV
jgi:hypothetical protein